MGGSLATRGARTIAIGTIAIDVRVAGSPGAGLARRTPKEAIMCDHSSRPSMELLRPSALDDRAGSRGLHLQGLLRRLWPACGAGLLAAFTIRCAAYRVLPGPIQHLGPRRSGDARRVSVDLRRRVLPVARDVRCVISRGCTRAPLVQSRDMPRPSNTRCRPRSRGLRLARTLRLLIA
jgi:hypothetical protein